MQSDPTTFLFIISCLAHDGIRTKLHILNFMYYDEEKGQSLNLGIRTCGTNAEERKVSSRSVQRVNRKIMMEAARI
jgi:hypothetical protein